MDIQKLSSNIEDYRRMQENNGWSYSLNKRQLPHAKARIDDLDKNINQEAYDTFVPSSKKNEQQQKEEKFYEKLGNKVFTELLKLHINNAIENGTVTSIDELAKKCFQDEIEEKGLSGVIGDILEAEDVSQEELDKKGLLGVLDDLNYKPNQE